MIESRPRQITVKPLEAVFIVLGIVLISVWGYHEATRPVPSAPIVGPDGVARPMTEAEVRHLIACLITSNPLNNDTNLSTQAQVSYVSYLQEQSKALEVHLSKVIVNHLL